MKPRSVLAVALGGLALVGVAAFVAVRSPLSAFCMIAQPTRAEVTSMSLEAAIEALNLMHSAHPLPVADFTIPTLDEGRFRLTDQRGKVVFVNFWAPGVRHATKRCRP